MCLWFPSPPPAQRDVRRGALSPRTLAADVNANRDNGFKNSFYRRPDYSVRTAAFRPSISPYPGTFAVRRSHYRVASRRALCPQTFYARPANSNKPPSVRGRPPRFPSVRRVNRRQTTHHRHARAAEPTPAPDVVLIVSVFDRVGQCVPSRVAAVSSSLQQPPPPPPPPARESLTR